MTNYRRDGKSSRAHTKTIRRNRSGQTRGYHQDQDQVNSHSVNSGNLYTSDYHSERYYRTLPPHPSLVTSPYRTNIQAEPLLIFRPKQVVVTYFTQAIEACRSHATTKSAQFPWYAVTALQPWPAAMMWICFMAPRMFSRRDPRRKRSKTNPSCRHSGAGTRPPAQYLPFPLLRALVESLLYDDDRASASCPGAHDNSRMFVLGPVTPHNAVLSPTHACADPFVHHVDEQPSVGGPDGAQPTSADLEPPPPLLDRLNSDQRDSYLRVWPKLPKHLREFSFDFQGPDWGPDVITQLARTLIEFADVLSTLSTDFGSYSLLPFKISVLPVIYRLWFVLPPAVQNFGPTRQHAGEFSPLWRESSRGQTKGHDSERVSQLAFNSTPHRRTRAPWSSSRRNPAGFGLLLTTKSRSTSAFSVNFPYPASTKSWTSWAQDGYFPL